MKKKCLLILASVMLLAVVISGLSLFTAGSGEEPMLKISSQNLSLEDNIYIYFRAWYDRVDTDRDDYGMLFFTEPREEGDYTYDNALQTAGAVICQGTSDWRYDSHEGRNVGTFTRKISAKEMGDTVYARAYARVDGRYYYSQVIPYSAAAYAARKLGFVQGVAGTSDEKLKTLLRDMLAYGASAQQYFGYRTDALVTDSLYPQYSISAVGGTLSDGSETGTFRAGSAVTLKADPKPGYAVSHWVDRNGNAVGGNALLRITVSESNTYTPVYFTGWMTDSMTKISSDIPEPDARAKAQTVSLPKGQTESCQLSLRADTGISGLTVSVSTDDRGVSLTPVVEKTVAVEGKYLPDGLVPLSVGGSLTLQKDTTLTLLLQCRAEKNAAAGDHVFLVSLRNAAGDVVDSYSVTARIWDFGCTDTPIRTYIPIDKESIALHYGLGDIRTEKLTAPEQAELDRLYKLYYDFLLDYGISGGDLPYDILDSRADAYLNDPRVTSFCVGTLEPDAARLTAVYNKLKTHPEWLAKAVYYALDEPTDSDMLDRLAAITAEVRRLAPGLKVVSSYFVNNRYRDGRDYTQFLMDTLDIIDPKLCCFDRFANLRSRTAAYQANGKEVWSYVCWEPGKPYVNLYVNEDGLDHRMLFWQLRQNGADGFLYWCANKWYDVININHNNPWNDMATVTWLTDDIYGDGCLVYPGVDFGIDGACSSLRLELVRDGIEDLALLEKAEQVFGKAWVDEKIRTVTRSVTDYTTDHAVFLAVRNAIGEALNGVLANRVPVDINAKIGNITVPVIEIPASKLFG